MEARLSWLVIGAGAIGTYIGGSLLLNGARVIFLEQPETASQLQERGLKLNILGQDYRILHPDMFSNLAHALSAAPIDAVVFALKSYDTQVALEDIRLHVSSMPPVLCLQNGVENEPALEAVLGKNKVIPGTVTSSVRRLDAGNVVLERLRGVGIAGGHPVSSSLVQELTSAGLNAHLYKFPLAMKWTKMLSNLLANAASAILDMTAAEILNTPGLYRNEIEQLREALAVMRALHLHPIDLPGVPMRLFAWVVKNLNPSLSRPLVSQFAGKGRGQKMPSFHIDLYSGRGKSEVDYLNGAVVRFGQKLHVPTPVNYWLNQTLLGLTQGIIPLDEYSHKPDKYLAGINASSNHAGESG